MIVGPTGCSTTATARRVTLCYRLVVSNDRVARRYGCSHGVHWSAVVTRGRPVPVRRVGRAVRRRVIRADRHRTRVQRLPTKGKKIDFESCKSLSFRIVFNFYSYLRNFYNNILFNVIVPSGYKQGEKKSWPE